MSKLLERDPPGLRHAGWQAMHSHLQYIIKRLGEAKGAVDEYQNGIEKEMARIAEFEKERQELIAAMNALRITVETSAE